MSVPLKTFDHVTIHEEIEHNSAWIGQVSGLTAEKMLRGIGHPYAFVIRAGEISQDEAVKNYYATFVGADGMRIRHVPFTITTSLEGWYYQNYGGGGPYNDAKIDDVIHLIMHCGKDECTPMVVDHQGS